MSKKILLLVLTSQFLSGFQIYRPTPIGGGGFSLHSVLSVDVNSNNTTGTDESQVSDSNELVDNVTDSNPFSNDDDYGHPTDNEDNSTEECEEEKSSNSGDQDNDVPTLLSIRSRVHSLQQELTAQAEKTRGSTIFQQGDSSSSREATLADIYDVLNKTQEKEEIKTKSDEKDDKQSETESKITDFFDNVKDDAENFAESFSVSDHNDNSMDTMFELDIGTYSFYLDPLKDTFYGGLKLGNTFAEVADWISLIIGITCVIIYYRNLKELVFHFLETILMAPKSSSVTNISVFGNSIGTIGLMVLKIGFIGVLVGTTIVSTFSVMYESNFTLGGSSQGVMSILSSITSILTAGGGWMSHAFSLFCDLVPVASISAMVAFYYLQRFGILVFIGAQIVLSQAFT